MYETKFEQIKDNKYLPYIDRYINRNGIKFYLSKTEPFWSDHHMRLGINFVAHPKYYDSSRIPEISFQFIITRLFMGSIGILDDNEKMSSFLYYFGYFEFKKWLNEISEVKTTNNTLEYTSQTDKPMNEFILNGEILRPIYSEDDDRLNKIAEEGILKEYNDSKGRYKVNYDLLKESLFVPDEIFNYSLEQLKDADYINEEKNILTKEGLAYYKNTVNLTLPQSKYSQTVFVAQSFNKEMIDFYETVTAPMIEEFKLNPIIISNEEPTEPIDIEILNQIRICRFMICDLTFSRPSVYFEAGYALGRGVNVIYTCRSDHNSDDEKFDSKTNKVHFDIRNRKISWWKEETMEEFKAELRSRIENFIKSQ